MTFLHPYQLYFLSVSKTKPGQHLGRHRHKVDSHISEKRATSPQGLPSSVLPAVEKTVDGRFIVRVPLTDNQATIVLMPSLPGGRMRLHIATSTGGPIPIDNVSQVTQLIDALYAIGAEWLASQVGKEVAGASF